MKKKRLSKKNLSIILIIIVVVLIFLVENKNIIGSFLGVKNQASENIPTININYGNIEEALSGNSIVRALPEDAVILLRFYNLNAGQREWEKSYVIKKTEVREGFVDNADIKVTIHSKYLEKLTNKNFCSVIQTASKNGDLAIETELSKVKLLWKFKGIIKYRGCLGF